MPVDLSRQKELGTDPKAIHQIEFIGQLKKLNNDNNNVEFVFVLIILQKKSKTQD